MSTNSNRFLVRRLLPIAVAVAACNESDPQGDGGEHSSHVDGHDSDMGDESGTGGAPAGCADPNDPSAPKVEVSSNLQGDNFWSCDKVYVLTSIVFVQDGTLTIAPGTTIQGASGSGLVIDSTATIDATGTPEAPIVMTSILPEGSRNRGDWGGLVLLGNATINVGGGTSTAEGFADPPPYGGSDPAHNCGTLRYLRVEWAGFEISAGSELNSITFAACGSDTTVDHVQVHMGSDDGIECFGGGFDAKHIIVTGAADDSLDLDEGFAGRFQHVFLQQDPAVGDNCLEWSNQGTGFTALPRTAPTVANLTCVGSGPGGDKSKGMTLKEGTGAKIYSSIFTNITNAGVEMIHAATQQMAESGGIVFQGAMFGTHAGFRVKVNDEEPAETQATWSGAELGAFILEQGDNLDNAAMDFEATWGAPMVKPPADSVAAQMGHNPDDAFFDATAYAGAVDPNGDDWTQASWVNYAVD